MTQDATPKTVGEVLGAAAEFLATKGVENSGFAAKLLMARLLGCKHLELPLRFNEALTAGQLGAMRRGTRRAAAGEPVQYILGQWEFMGHTFKVDTRALIPRPETEILVNTVLERESVWSGADRAGNVDPGNPERPVVVDLGTGTGCIVISLALARPGASYVGLDTSMEAVELARENCTTLGLADKVRVACTELSDCFDAESIDLLTANLPYVATAEYEELPVHIREFEPRSALDGGADGLRVIEPCVHDAAIALRPGGSLFLEIGDTQAPAVTSLLESVGFSRVSVSKDLNGRDRVVSGVLEGGDEQG